MVTKKQPPKRVRAADIVAQSAKKPARTKPEKPAAPPLLTNRFAIVLDNSGSMSGLRDPVVRVFNQNLDAIADASKAEGQQSSITHLQFAESIGGSVRPEVVYANRPVESAQRLSRTTYVPNTSSTPLFATVGKAIETLSSLPKAEDDKTSNVVIVVTDGHDNMAVDGWSSWKLNDEMRKRMASDRWSFAFLVPPGHAEKLIRDFGIPAGNVMEWEQTEKGVERMGEQLAAGARSFAKGRTLGHRSTRSYFTTDTSKLTTTEVKKNLSDISKHVKVWQVTKEIDITSFVESHRVPFETGRGFYQLTKPEKIQGYKKIILREKGKKAIFFGDGARTMLGLPDNPHAEVKVHPGNHGKWDIFVQSTSPNRKLVRGTELIYDQR